MDSQTSAVVAVVVSNQKLYMYDYSVRNTVSQKNLLIVLEYDKKMYSRGINKVESVYKFIHVYIYSFRSLWHYFYTGCVFAIVDIFWYGKNVYKGYCLYK
jgi:hypothetical protein